jgi:methylenetetrahydrofolate dehydrogenase (NADP+)/methenyltetrahydrofolate cyclohydrolase
MIIDGTPIATRILDYVARETSKLPTKPRLAVVQVGENPASAVYVRKKLEAARAIGMETVSAQLDSGTTLESLVGLIDGFNRSEAFNGILVQLPLPEHIQLEPVIEALEPLKDVDGLHPLNVGRLTVRSTRDYLHPCTPWGIVHTLDTVFPKRGGMSGLRGKQVAVIGQSYIVGRPLSIMLQNEGATVIMCDKFTPDLKLAVRHADIIVTATGVPGLIDNAFLDAVDNPALTIIDAGISRRAGKTLGDVDRGVYHRVQNYTPVPGGVGPVTVAFLMRNMLKAYCMQNGLPVPRVT